MAKKVTIVAGGNYGSTYADYSVDENGTMRLVAPGETSNLQGNGLANTFGGQKLGEIDFDKISSENRCYRQRCGCHLCGFSVGVVRLTSDENW